MKEQQRSSNNIEQIASLFNTLNTAWRKTSENVKARKIDGGNNEDDKMSRSDVTSLSTEVKGNKSVTMQANLMLIQTFFLFMPRSIRRKIH